MICITGNRPVIQIGHHHVVGYETDWIDRALNRAARRCNREDFPFISDIRNGVIHYLENRCTLQVLPIEKLYDRMKAMLIRIGCQAIADNLQIICPPVKLSLSHLARNCQSGARGHGSGGYELVFHNILRKEIAFLRRQGVEEVHLSGSRKCTRLLNSCDTWNPACEQFHQDLLSHLQQISQQALSAASNPKMKQRNLKIHYSDL